MAIYFTGQQRIRNGGQDYPLHGFTVVPAHVRPAGLAPEAEDAMRASGPPQPPVFYFETVTFSSEASFTVGETYDYISSDDKHGNLKILTADKMKYRGVL